MKNLIEAIFIKENLPIENITAVHGGDINQAYKVQSVENSYFIKINSATDYPKKFKKEAEGLRALQQSTSFKVPNVILYGEYQDSQYLVLEWIDKSSPGKNFWQYAALGLAQLHKTTNNVFGWPSSNYIGSIHQPNELIDSWSNFYATQRILPLVKKLVNNNSFTKTEAGSAEKLCNKLNDLFPSEPPALLHGDLWAGNFMPAKNGDTTMPAVYDPAVYFGHREMDIGMSLLFGGFDKEMYQVYNDVFPLEKNWQQRIRLTQLYPLLVHAVLFGGSYISQCRSIIQEYA